MRLMLIVVAALTGGSSPPDPIPPAKLSGVQQAVAAEYRRSVHRGAVMFRNEKWIEGRSAYCGWVTSMDDDGYLTGWRGFLALSETGPVVIGAPNDTHVVAACD